MTFPSTAHNLTIKLEGYWYGHYGSAPCPICQPEKRQGQNALTLKDGTGGILLHCKKLNCEFREIAIALGLFSVAISSPNPEILAQRNKKRIADVEKRSRQAKSVWMEAQPISDTIAERYLRSRGIICELGTNFRFHPATWHGATAKVLPALVALVEGVEGFAVHRTYLQDDGLGKADVQPNKAMLGAVAGGAVRLNSGNLTLVVAEGIETTLSLASGLWVEPATYWAALSTSGVRNLRLPPVPQRLVIAPDGDPAGKAAANALAYRAVSLGWAVDLLPAPDGMDWNDVRMEEGGA